LPARHRTLLPGAYRPRLPRARPSPEDGPMPFTTDEVLSLLERPLLDLVLDAAIVQRRHHDPSDVPRCALLSAETGGGPEDRGHCPQGGASVGAKTGQRLMGVGEVLETARRAKEGGGTRFCMGAAWRSVKDGPEFDRVLEMVRGVASLGVEVCATLGML